jgi:site-specific DNA-cytosine methylase
VRVLDLFAGIGGFTIGLERAGFETAAFCEIDPYAQKVLRKNWPGVPIYDDVRTITAERLAADGIGVDVITGGFPCQDISVAGNQAGIQDGTRSGLWSECARLIGELRPRYAIFENVTNLLNGERGAWFKRVLWDISALGYDAEWHCIPASAVGAPHRRDRVWVLGYRNGQPEQPVYSGGSEKGGGETSPPGPLHTDDASSNTGVVADPNSPRLEVGQRESRDDGSEQSAVVGAGQMGHTSSPRLPNGAGEALGQSRAEPQPERPGSQDRRWWAVEPGMGDLADGLPANVEQLPLVEGYAILMAHADATKRNSAESLRELRNTVCQETLCEWALGGLQPVPKAEVLFAFLCQLEARLPSDAPDLALEIEEVPNECLRKLWAGEPITCPPCRWRHYQPDFKQSTDALYTLSQLLARAAGEAWIEACSEDASITWAGLTVPRVSRKVPGRVDRLKQLGNSVVPQIPELIGRAILQRHQRVGP